MSSLGHSVLLPALIGGRWATDLNVSAPESPYLAFIVGLHVATAAALLVYFWRDWVRIISGFVTSMRYRRVETADERLAWMIIIATIPVGIAGPAAGAYVPHRPRSAGSGGGLSHHQRHDPVRRRAPAASRGRRVGTSVGVGPSPSAPMTAERCTRRRRTPSDGTPTWSRPTPATPARIPVSAGGVGGGPERVPAIPLGDATEPADMADESNARIARRRIAETTLIGSAQILALLPGISRSGVTMAAGLRRGLSHEDAARFSFLLATPVILAAGALKLPDLTGPMGNGIGGQVLLGSLASAVGAYAAVRWLTRYFQTRTLTPFAIYCVVAGLASLVYLAIR